MNPSPQRDPFMTRLALAAILLGLAAGAYLVWQGGASQPPGPAPIPISTGMTLSPTHQAPEPSPTPLVTVRPFPTPLPALNENPPEGRGGAVKVGDPAPGFSLKTLAGGTASLQDYRGKVVWINFWATWCPPCKDEMPAMQTLYERYRDQGLVILGIDYTIADPVEDVRNFLDQVKVTYPILLDENGKVNDQVYAVPGLPESVVVDRQGVVQQVEVGGFDLGAMEQVIQGLLK